MNNTTFFKCILLLTNILLISLAVAGIILSYYVVTPMVKREIDAELAILTMSMIGWGVLLILFSVCLISIVFSNLICLHLLAALLTCCPLSLAIYLIVRQFLDYDTKNYIVIALCIVASVLWIVQIFVEICLAFNLCCTAGLAASSTSSLAKLDEEKHTDGKDEQDADEESKKDKKDKKKKKEEKKKKSKKDEKSATDEEKQHLVNENLASPASNGEKDVEQATTSAASTLEAKHQANEKPQLQNYNHQQTIEKEQLQQKSSNQQYQMQMLKQHDITHQQTKTSQSHLERKEIQIEEQTIKSKSSEELKKQEFLKQQEQLRIEELRRQEELRKQQEQLRIEEIKRKEEQRRREEEIRRKQIEV